MMNDDGTTKTWWIWNATLDAQGFHVVIEVDTVNAEGFRVDTPVAYFVECDSGSGVPDWVGTRVMIGNEEFAKLRAEGAITPLSPEWAVS